MPFPWKKSKITLISRMVAGLNKTPKRGGSLVVETGFPTSLIDLFVKNRDRLRRSSKRESVPTRSYPLPLPPCNQEIQIQSADDTNIRELVTDDDEKKKKKIELHLVFRVSLMVAFAVCTRNLAIWIVMAAFLFMGFEFFGSSLKSRSNELILEREVTEFTTDGLTELENGLKMETILTSKQKQDCEQSRSSRIKLSLIKKFVPKKLRHRNKKNQEKLLENEKRVEEGTESETELISVRTSYKNDQILRQVESAENEKKNLRKGNSGYMIMFVVVILAGLIGSRGFALLLTLLCSLMIPIYIRTRKSDADLNSRRKTG